MNPQIQRAGLATGSRARNPVSVLGHTIMLVPPLVVFGCCAVGAYVVAPLVVPQAEVALEDAAWAIGRVWAGGVALTHFCEGAVRHDRIVADEPVEALPPRPRLPIIIVPHPGIEAPPLRPRRGGWPEDHARSKHHHRVAPRSDASALLPERRSAEDLTAPVQSRKTDGDTP